MRTRKKNRKAGTVVDIPKPTLANARKVVAYWDSVDREREEVEAQADYLHALDYAEEIVERAEKGTRRWAKRKRNAELASRRAEAKRFIRDGLQRVKFPTIYSDRVTGQDISEASRQNTVPRESRSLAGVRGTVVQSRASRRWSVFGPQKRTEYVTLRSSGGRILATVIVAGCERDLYARLVAVLMKADESRP